jgi:TPR repeat protein
MARLAWLTLGVVILAAGSAAWIKTARDAAPVAQDIQSGRYELAFSKLKKPAEDGDPWSQNQLGNLYYLGMGVKADMDEAFKWYLRAALNNWADAQINVAMMYRYGRGVKSDLLRAWAWQRHARSNGKEIAEIYMSWMAGSLTLTPSQMQLSKELYADREALRPEGFK